MRKEAFLLAMFLGLLSFAPLFAQSDAKIELIPYIGYTFSEGVPVNPTDVGSGQIVDRVNPVSGLSYGFEVNALLGENAYAGFNFSQQDSNLEGKFQGGGKEKFTDMKVRNYHGILGYNFGDADETIRPFLFGGLGATDYSPSPINGQSVDGRTRFSTTWGGGVKAFVSENLGFRFTGRWTPTHINSEAGGIWCSPLWPWNCWVLENPNYSNQFEMSGGVVIRF